MPIRTRRQDKFLRGTQVAEAEGVITTLSGGSTLLYGQEAEVTHLMRVDLIIVILYAGSAILTYSIRKFHSHL